MIVNTTRTSRIDQIAWGVLIFDVVLIFLVAGQSLTATNLVWVLVLLAWLFLSLAVATVMLTIRYRHRFKDWRLWLALIVLFILGAMIGQGVIHSSQAGFMLLGSMAFLFVGLSLLIALCMYLFQRDIGLPLIGWVTVIVIWSALIAWRVQGNLIDALFQSIEQPNQPSSLWWLNLLFSSACCLVPLGLLSFTWHTVVLLRRELQGESPRLEAGERR
jgi:hypothetical protein